MNHNGNLGIANPNKDYDVLYKIVLIGDSGLFVFYKLYLSNHFN